MKKISIIFLLFTVLMTAIFTSCENPTTTMEPLTEDMIDEWIIGTWDFNTIIETKIGEQSQTTNTTGKYEIKNFLNTEECGSGESYNNEIPLKYNLPLKIK